MANESNNPARFDEASIKFYVSGRDAEMGRSFSWSDSRISKKALLAAIDCVPKHLDPEGTLASLREFLSSATDQRRK